MVFSWLKRRRRRRLLAQPFPEDWVRALEALPFYGTLAAAEKSTLHDILRVIVAEKHWEGCGGLTLTEEMQVVIAGHAALLLLGLEHDYYPQFDTILVYPSSYRVGPRHLEDGIYAEDAEHAGEAWYRGPVILSWDQVLDGAQYGQDGVNVALHEFAHKLDFESGVIDGTPPLPSREAAVRWADVMTRAYEQLCEEDENDVDTLLDPYGATNEAEFFAVATETFFEMPVDMQEELPELYEVLRDFFGQDPAARYLAADP